MKVLLFVGLGLAIWRVTRLLVTDEFPPVRAVREWVVHTFGAMDADGKIVGGKHLGEIGYALAYLWTCPWCMSVWAGAVVVALADWRLSVPYPWLIVAAGSLLSGFGSQVESEHEQRWELRDRDLRDRKR